MIIQATDGVGIYVPRFCYHEKLSSRGQLPHVPGRGRKGAEARAGMCDSGGRGHEGLHPSPRAIAAQSATMEFLLINHPLDCPICDQGGECELQDLAMGFGRDVSRFTESKRVVTDKNIGPLISTDMTRCIQCTRCVRFARGDRRHPGARRLRPRRVHGDRHLHRAQRRPRAVGQRHRPVPRRSAQHQAVPLSRARLGDDEQPHRRAARLRRLEPVRARPARAPDARGAASERVDQRDLDLRPRPLQLRGHLRRRSPAAPLVRERRAWREVAGRRRSSSAAAGAARRRSRSSRCWPRRHRPSRSCISCRSRARSRVARSRSPRCACRTSATRSAIHCFRRSALASPTWRRWTRVLVIGSTCAARRRSWRTACARPRRRGARVSFLNPARFEYLFPVAHYLEAPDGD